jgi:hypothetical protein
MIKFRNALAESSLRFFIFAAIDFAPSFVNRRNSSIVNP